MDKEEEKKEYFLLTFVLNHKKKIHYFLLMFLFSGIVFYKWGFKSDKKISIYQKADQYFMSYKKKPNEKTLNDLKALMIKYPEIEKKYLSLIDDPAFINQSLSQIPEENREYRLFSEISLQIQKGEWEKSLKDSLALDSILDKDSVLYNYNLLRIAMLFDRTGDKERKKTISEKLKNVS